MKHDEREDSDIARGISCKLFGKILRNLWKAVAHVANHLGRAKRSHVRQARKHDESLTAFSVAVNSHFLARPSA